MTGHISRRLGVVLVNWNRSADTIECLESLLRSTVPITIVVVDNASADGSVDHILAWAKGTAPALAADAAMASFSQPPAAKPVQLDRIAAATLAARADTPLSGLTLIESGGNLGFAGGNNLGIRLLLTDPGIDRIWLLNNDTVADPGAAAALLAYTDANPGIGMCGTTVRYYYRSGTVQALGGSRFNPLTGQSRSIGAGQSATSAVDPAAVTADLDFILGASLIASRAFIQTIGLMEESYFLYFEEIDWAARNKGRFSLGFAPKAVVFHKEGGSIGSSGTAGERSAMSEYWLNRSRLAFTRRHHPMLLPWHWLLTTAFICRRLMRGQPAKAGAISRALFGLNN